MALNDDSSLRMLLDDLQRFADNFKPTFDAGVVKYLETLKSKIAALMLHPDSLRVSSGPNSDGHDGFSMAKQAIQVDTKKVYEEVEKEWMDHLSRMKAEFTHKVEEFLQNTKLAVKLPIPKFLTYGPNSNSVIPCTPSNSHYGVNQEPTTETSDLMPSGSQDTFELIRHSHGTEDVEPQGSTNLSISCSEETPCTQFAKANSQSPVATPANQVVPCSTANASNAVCQSSTLSPISAPSLEPATLNATAQNIYPGNQSITNPAPQNQPKVVVSPRKKYGCPDCEKSYDHESELRLHMPKHTGERPYPCDYCGKRFRHQGTRDRHQKLRRCKKIN